MSIQIAIDGPAGAGKTTVAKEIASRACFLYVDTGAIYRAIGLRLDRHGIDPYDEEKVNAACKDIHIAIEYSKTGGQAVWLDGEDVTGLLRTQRISRMASAASTNGEVRKLATQIARDAAAKGHNIVMEGRDIGTCVLYDAKVKIYLTASIDVRATRRMMELGAANFGTGKTIDYTEIKKDMILRDSQDMNRKLSPLQQAPDAIPIDSSNLTIDQVVSVILAIAFPK